MSRLVTYIILLSLGVSGLIGITLSVTLQSPTVILIGIAGLLCALTLLRCDFEANTKYLLGLAMLAMLYFVARAIFSPVRDLGIQDLMLILPAGLLYLISGYGVDGNNSVRLRQGLAWVVIVLLILNVSLAIMQLDGSEGYSFSNYFTSARRSSEGGVTGIYSYYGSFANFSVIAGILSLSLGVWGRCPYLIRSLLFILGLMALALAVWSQSRSAVISLVIAIGVYGLLTYISVAKLNRLHRRRIRGGLFLLGVLGIGLMAVASTWVFNNRSTEVDVKGIEVLFASHARLQFWGMAAEQWFDHPIIGAGSRSYSYECFRYWNTSLHAATPNPEFVHNEYLQLLADYGLVGLLLILVLFGWHFYRGGKQVLGLTEKVGKNGLKRGSNAMALAIAGMSGMTAMAVHIIFDFRTHLLANLLLLICCAVWILPIPRVRKENGSQKKEGRGQRVGSWVLSLVMMVLSIGAIGMGGLQLWGGLPLVKSKMTKEDGAWVPESVPRPLWIATLEDAVAKVPHYVRYQRLGTLYRLDAHESVGLDKERNNKKAIKAYMSSIERHPYNVVPWANLALVYYEEKQFEKANEIFVQAAELAKHREQWYNTYSNWAQFHAAWAEELIKEEKVTEGMIHYAKSRELYIQSYKLCRSTSREWKYAWRTDYSAAMNRYVYLLDKQKNFEASSEIMEEVMSYARLPLSIKFYADHRRRYGISLWYTRKPDQALAVLTKAKFDYRRYLRKRKNKTIDSITETNLKKVEEIIQFLKSAGVEPAKD